MNYQIAGAENTRPENAGSENGDWKMQDFAPRTWKMKDHAM